MSLTIAQIEEQIANLQNTLEELKNPKLKICREFTGQYFDLYQSKQYRRMESEGIPIWECYLDAKKEWIVSTTQESKNLEKNYQRDCISE